MRNPLTFENANCAGTDPEAWWPESGPRWETDTPRRVCGNCVEVNDCLEWALHYEADGIWGGTTAADRKEIRRRRGIRLKGAELLPSFYARLG